MCLFSLQKKRLRGKSSCSLQLPKEKGMGGKIATFFSEGHRRTEATDKRQQKLWLCVWKKKKNKLIKTTTTTTPKHHISSLPTRVGLLI